MGCWGLISPVCLNGFHMHPVLQTTLLPSLPSPSPLLFLLFTMDGAKQAPYHGAPALELHLSTNLGN